ncbi:MAG: hypothetical protein M1819_000903 [Sarea resinae]|nr:MAG: hypothetical protein M1819_000903 [Sarea resinae]
MSDSEGSLSTPRPSNAVLEKALRAAVKNLFQSGIFQPEELTVKRMRTAAEQELGLPGGFYKNDETWNSKSKLVVSAEADTQHELRDRAKEQSPHLETAEPRKLKPANTTKPSTTKKTKGTKRASPDEPEPRKRRKSAALIESDSEVAEQISDVEVSEPEEQPKRRRKTVSPKDTKRKKAPTKANNEDETKDEAMEENSTEISPVPNDTTKTGTPDVAGSESEMSVVLDEDSAPKRKRQKSTSTPRSKKNSKSKPAKTKDDPSIGPEEAEIKRLQSWLLKCGIRKLWYRELAPYDTSRSKIQHLKGMLKDVGMDGRYSVEKARQIKEERELKAELEAVQEGAKQWGEDAEDREEGGRPKRRLAKGLRELDFLGDDEGEDSG